MLPPTHCGGRRMTEQRRVTEIGEKARGRGTEKGSTLQANGCAAASWLRHAHSTHCCGRARAQPRGPCAGLTPMIGAQSPWPL